MLSLRYPASHEGRFAIVTNVGCGMRWARWVAAWVISARTNIPMRTVKPCGPGIPVLMPSARGRFARDGGKNAGPRGELGVNRKAIAQGRPDVRLNLW
jgi:hypothetical protein